MDWLTPFVAGNYAEAAAILEKEASRERRPGISALALGAVRSLIEGDRKYLDAAVNAVRANVPEDALRAFVGAILWGMGLKAEAVGELGEAVAEARSGTFAMAGGAILNAFPECVDAFMEVFDKVLARDPTNVCALIGRAQAKRIKAEELLPQAMEDFTAALRIDPGCAWGHYYAGYSLILMGEFRRARNYLRASLAFDLDIPQYAHACLAECHFRLGDLSEAKMEALQALAADPQDDTVKDILQKINAAMGASPDTGATPADS